MIRCVFAAFMVAAAAYGASAADPTCHFVGQTGYVCMNEGEACYDSFVCTQADNYCEGTVDGIGICAKPRSASEVYGAHCKLGSDAICGEDYSGLVGFRCTDGDQYGIRCRVLPGPPGDGCTLDMECNGNMKCVNGACQGVAQGGACNQDTSLTAPECEPDTYCSNGKCVPRLQADGVCDDDLQCEPGTLCVAVGPNATEYKCVPTFSLPEGTVVRSTSSVENAVCQSGWTNVVNQYEMCAALPFDFEGTVCNGTTYKAGYECVCAADDRPRWRKTENSYMRESSADYIMAYQAYMDCMMGSGCTWGTALGSEASVGTCLYYACYDEWQYLQCAKHHQPTNVLEMFEKFPDCYLQSAEFNSTVSITKCMQLKPKCQSVPGFNSGSCPDATPSPGPSTAPDPSPSQFPSPAPSQSTSPQYTHVPWIPTVGPLDSSNGGAIAAGIIIPLVLIGGVGGLMFYRKRRGMSAVPEPVARYATCQPCRGGGRSGFVSTTSTGGAAATGGSRVSGTSTTARTYTEL